MGAQNNGTGVERIAAERARQVDKEGWSAEHDDEHDVGELAMAAACYAAPEKLYAQETLDNMVQFIEPWPWSPRDDKRPHVGNVVTPARATRAQRIRLLEKAGALIAAEIDRLLRAAPKEPK